MKFLVFMLATALVAMADINGTFDPSLPDVALYDYSGDQSITASISTVDFRRQVTAGNNALCGGAGAQGAAANPTAPFAGGRLVWSGATGYPVDPINGRIVLQCLPLQIQLSAGWYSTRIDQVNDHLRQDDTNTAIGGVVGSTPTQSTSVEACSLIGVSSLGTPYLTYYVTGQCLFYGEGTGPYPPGGGSHF